ncbi:unnamed protein product [Amaranthus hypochondriacus]
MNEELPATWPKTAEEIFTDFMGRNLTADARRFHQLCDPDDSEDVPTYIVDLDKAQSKLSSLSSKSNSNSSKESTKSEVNDGVVTNLEEKSQSKLGIEDKKCFEEVQRLIDGGKVEELKLEQCKVYLRKHGLRLTGKKDILIQRIKEHLEIINGGGEKKYPESSFLLNCKGDACTGDIVMFQQTVYEGYSIVSRSAIGAPCGKRTVAGRIVKESYGAAKQQHTFTVEVLWSKGEKPLPPLHPLLIKGRNLYKLNTLRQRWEDESQRQRVLSEKHNRGFIARSNREVRIQVKMSRQMLKDARTFSKEGQHSCQEKNHEHAKDHVGSKDPKQQTVAMQTQKLQSNHVQNLKAAAQLEKNSNTGLTRSQPPLLNGPNDPTSQGCFSYRDPNFQHSRPTNFTSWAFSHFSDKFQQQHYWEYKENVNHEHAKDHVGSKDPKQQTVIMQIQKLQSNHVQNLKAAAQLEKNSITGSTRSQPPQLNGPNDQTSRGCLSYRDPNIQHSGPANSISVAYSRFPDKFQQQHYREYKENVPQPGLHPCLFQMNVSNDETNRQLLVSNGASSLNFPGIYHHKERQKPCRYYLQGYCHHGDRCKFKHG